VRLQSLYQNSGISFYLTGVPGNKKAEDFSPAFKAILIRWN